MKLKYKTPSAQIVRAIESYCDTELNVSSTNLGDALGGGSEDILDDGYEDLN